MIGNPLARKTLKVSIYSNPSMLRVSSMVAPSEA
jgi:hypothetical protein